MSMWWYGVFPVDAATPAPLVEEYHAPIGHPTGFALVARASFLAASLLSAQVANLVANVDAPVITQNRPVDNFDDNSIDSAIWSLGAGGTVVEQNQRLEMGAGQVSPQEDSANTITVPGFDLNQGIFVRLVKWGGAGTVSRLIVEDNSANTLTLAADDTGVLRARRGASTLATTTYVPATHAWFRIIEIAGNLHWQTAPITASNPPLSGDWVDLHSEAIGAFNSANVVAVHLETSTSSGTSIGTFWDGFNTAATVISVDEVYWQKPFVYPSEWSIDRFRATDDLPVTTVTIVEQEYEAPALISYKSKHNIQAIYDQLELPLLLVDEVHSYNPAPLREKRNLSLPWNWDNGDIAFVPPTAISEEHDVLTLISYKSKYNALTIYDQPELPLLLVDESVGPAPFIWPAYRGLQPQTIEDDLPITPPQLIVEDEGYVPGVIRDKRYSFTPWEYDQPELSLVSVIADDVYIPAFVWQEKRSILPIWPDDEVVTVVPPVLVVDDESVVTYIDRLPRRNIAFPWNWDEGDFISTPPAPIVEDDPISSIFLSRTPPYIICLPYGWENDLVPTAAAPIREDDPGRQPFRPKLHKIPRPWIWDQDVTVTVPPPIGIEETIWLRLIRWPQRFASQPSNSSDELVVQSTVVATATIQWESFSTATPDPPPVIIEKPPCSPGPSGPVVACADPEGNSIGTVAGSVREFQSEFET